METSSTCNCLLKWVRFTIEQKKITPWIFWPHRHQHDLIQNLAINLMTNTVIHLFSVALFPLCFCAVIPILANTVFWIELHICGSAQRCVRYTLLLIFCFTFSLTLHHSSDFLKNVIILCDIAGFIDAAKKKNRSDYYSYGLRIVFVTQLQDWRGVSLTEALWGV